MPIDFAMSPEHPKFVMQVGRQQPVPKLVSINEFSSSTYTQVNRKDKQQKSGIREKTPVRSNKKFSNNFYDSREESSLQEENDLHLNYEERASYNDANGHLGSKMQNSLTEQSRPQFQPSSYYTTLRKQLPVTEGQNYRLEVIQLQKLLQIEQEQKLQLQQIIKQLTLKSEKLQEVNEHIVQRLRQIEKNFVQEKILQEKELAERVRKAVTQAYQDVEEFVRNQVEQLTRKLKGERMTPLLQKKLQLFMETILQVNQSTVEMCKISKNKANRQQNILSQFLSSATHEKQNLNSSKLYNRLGIPEASFMSKSSQKRDSSSKKKDSSSPGRDRRLINNAYITSYKKRTSPSRVLFQTPNTQQNYPEYTDTIPQQQNNRQSSNYDHQSPGQMTQGHISFLDHFKTHNQEIKELNRRRDNSIGESFVEGKKHFQTANYQDKNFRVNQYTPNKRKKIFDGVESRSKSKYRNSRKG